MNARKVSHGNSLELGNPDSHLEVREVLQYQEDLVGLAMNHTQHLGFLGDLGCQLIRDLQFVLYNQWLLLGQVLLWRQSLLSGGPVLCL